MNKNINIVKKQKILQNLEETNAIESFIINMYQIKQLKLYIPKDERHINSRKEEVKRVFDISEEDFNEMIEEDFDELILKYCIDRNAI